MKMKRNPADGSSDYLDLLNEEIANCQRQIHLLEDRIMVLASQKEVIENGMDDGK